MIHCDSTIEPLHGELADLPSTSLELSEPEALADFLRRGLASALN